MKDKKGLSPVIATVLLIAMVIVLALIIFLWFRGMAQEAITKFDNKNVELVCADTNFEASYSGGTLLIQNNGQVPIYAMKIRKEGGGSHSTKNIEESEGWPSKGLNPGRTYSGSVAKEGATEFLLIPVLIGKNDEGVKKTYVCDNQHGEEVTL
jgi:flagellin-like protein